MNLATFRDGLLIVWFIGGILLIPFNSLSLGFLITLYFNLDYDRWNECVKALWVLQILWNLVFMYTGVILEHVIGAEKGEITYDLVATHPDEYPDLNIWDYRFYYKKADGSYTKIENDSKDATPFQKAMDTQFEIDPENGLDPEGLHAGKNDTSHTWLVEKFNELPEGEARAYIDRYNKTHSGNSLAEDIFFPLIFAAVAPFLITFPEALIIAVILLILEFFGGIGAFFARFS
jgi:hypothetical protein